MNTIRKVQFMPSKEEGLELHNPLGILGMPGVGDIGKFAIDQLIGIFNAEKFCDIIFSDYPAGAIVEGSLLSTPKCEILIWKDPKHRQDLIFVTADAQAMTPRGIYEISDAIAEILVLELDVNLILSLGAYPMKNSDNNFETIYVTSTEYSWVERLIEDDVCKPVDKGVIIGSNGLVPTLAAARFQVDGLVIMAETENQAMLSDNFTDLQASIRLIKILAKHFDLPIEAKFDEKRVLEISEDLENKKKAMEKEMDIQLSFENGGAEGGSLYI